MVLIKKGLVFLGLLFPIQVAMATNSNDDIANFLCKKVFSNETYSYHDYFSKEFSNSIPEPYFHSIVNEVIEATGKCVQVQKLVNTNPNTSSYHLISQDNSYSAISFSIDTAGFIENFGINDVVIKSLIVNSWSEAVTNLNSLHGKTSLTIQNFNGISNELRSNELQPLGSGFKLYVLKALAEEIKNGHLRWNDEFPVTEKWKSLPSGIMHNWQNGKMVSLYDYAEYMIKISDNTATDHLLNIVGREKIEKQIKLLGNAFISKNTPLLSTAEMFKLKWGAPLSLIESFIHGTESQRRTILDIDVAQISLDKVGTNGVSPNLPSYIHSIEWFGSTNDLCNAMYSLKELASKEVMATLNKNVPFIKIGPNHHWQYGGYKGGSEPGVLTMTYLLQNKGGNWGCVSMAWHNEKKNINQWVFYNLIQKVLKVAEKEIVTLDL